MLLRVVVPSLLLALLPGRASSACSPVGTLKTYAPLDDSNILLNPERGFYGGFYCYSSALTAIDVADLQSLWTDSKVSVVIIIYGLEKFVASNISSAMLTTIQSDMATLRAAGMKAIIRFSYSDVSGNYADAAITQLLYHIGQIKPILQSNSDVILTLQAGFVGTWGEWYFSSNYATQTSSGDFVPTAVQQANRMRIIAALVNALPAERMLQLRTPNSKMQFCNTSANLPASKAFDSTNVCSRIGIHNDCFMALEQDQGTFTDDSQRTWLFNEGQYVMTGGESCEVNSQTDCSSATNQILRQRFTYLNMDYHDQVLSGWKAAGCYNKIANLMGYRFQLISGNFPSQVTRGASFCATISLKNTGVTNLMNARPVQVLLRNKASGALSAAFPVSSDPRLWAPNSTVTIELQFTVPTSLSTGLYDVILNLPDAAASLAGKANYRILLANAAVAEAATRFNILNQVTLA